MIRDWLIHLLGGYCKGDLSQLGQIQEMVYEIHRSIFYDVAPGDPFKVSQLSKDEEQFQSIPTTRGMSWPRVKRALEYRELKRNRELAMEAKEHADAVEKHWKEKEL